MTWPRMDDFSAPAGLVALWRSVLDEMEAELSAADPSASPWTPPPHLGPMPEFLRERAQTLVRDQEAALVKLDDALLAAAADLAAAAPVRRSTPAVYLDVMG